MTKEIVLSRGKVALVDDAAFAELNQWKWSFMPHHSTGYAIRKCKVSGKMILMHRQATAAPDGMQVDHINGNGLDNRSANLRVVTQSINQQNRPKYTKNAASRFIGVCQSRGRWIARIRHDNRRQYIGSFDTEIEAAKAYNKAALAIYGPQARLNF